ncbi:MAG: immunoglobulin domain-containing protein, partial [Limisphaerales bacterium]
ATNNAIAQVVFGVNPINGTNYVFALDANNGIMGLTLSTGPVPPPIILSQPRSQRVVQGSAFSLTVVLDSRAATQWQKDSGSGFTNLFSGTNTTYTVNNSVAADSGNYRLIASNSSGAVTSLVATIVVSLPADNYSLSPLWTAIPPAQTYVSTDGGPNTPKERSITFNAVSNQLIILRDPVNGNPAQGTPEIHVLNADTGTELYTMNITGIFRGSESEIVGSNPLDLTQIAAGADGSIYACNEVPNGGGGIIAPSDSKKFRVYRWLNSSPDTLPVQIFAGDPAGQTNINLRWGDVMTVRGTGTNTEILLDDVLGSYAGILKPIDATLTIFTNIPITTPTGGGSIGRSIQFQSVTGTNFWQKKKGGPLFLTKYNASTGIGTQIAKYDNFSLTLGAVAIDATRNLAIGVDFVGNSTSAADALALYEISDLTTPLLIARYPFPIVPQVANNNFICSTVIAGNRVFSLDANNGLIAMNIVNPVNSQSPVLTITRSGSNVILSWNAPDFILQATPSLSPPITWTDLTVAGQTNFMDNASSGNKFYRLRKP